MDRHRQIQVCVCLSGCISIGISFNICSVCVGGRTHPHLQISNQPAHTLYRHNRNLKQTFDLRSFVYLLTSLLITHLCIMWNLCVFDEGALQDTAAACGRGVCLDRRQWGALSRAGRWMQLCLIGRVCVISNVVCMRIRSLSAYWIRLGHSQSMLHVLKALCKRRRRQCAPSKTTRPDRTSVTQLLALINGDHSHIEVFTWF